MQDSELSVKITSEPVLPGDPVRSTDIYNVENYTDAVTGPPYDNTRGGNNSSDGTLHDATSLHSAVGDVTVSRDNLLYADDDNVEPYKEYASADFGNQRKKACNCGRVISPTVSVFMAIWLFLGLLSYVASILCLTDVGSFEQKLFGLFLALGFGPFYFVYAMSSSTYCPHITRSLKKFLIRRS